MGKREEKKKQKEVEREDRGDKRRDRALNKILTAVVENKVAGGYKNRQRENRVLGPHQPPRVD